MLNNNLNNSFNIHSENIREPNLVNDEEVSISTYIHNSKGFYFYNQDLGLENKNVLELTLLELSNLNSQVTKIDGNFEKEIMLNYFQSELLKNGFSNNLDNENVGIHEFSHLIDKSDGLIDGKPFFIEYEEELIWFHLLDAEIDKIKSNYSDINPYALTNYSEFFAVIMEYYKENPTDFKRNHIKLFYFLKSRLTK